MSDGPVGVIFETSEDTVIRGVDYKLRAFRLWDPKVDEGDRPMDGIVETEQLIEGRRADESVFGDRILTFDVPGQILLAGGAVVLNQPFALRQWIEQGGDVIIDRAGWAQQKGALEVFASVVGKVGEYWNLEAPHQVNAKVGQSPITQRGGTRKVQIIGRTEKAGTSVAQLLDAGNLAQDPPEAPDPGTIGNDPNDGIPIPELSLAPSADDPLTIATVTVDNADDITPLNGDVYLEYAVQETEPTGAGTPFGPVRTSEGLDTLDLPSIESGETIWVRGQTRITSTGQLSDWSDWISITLGPDDDGGGGTLPPFLLALSIDSDGVLSAEANSTVAAIVKVYFVAGPAGGAAPAFADVLAGSVDSSGPPFTAAALATMDEGEVRTVGAIGEDALGNRTTQVNASITRAVDTGSGSGTPGNLMLTLSAGAPILISAWPSEPTRVAEFNVSPASLNFLKTGAVKIECPVIIAGPAGAKLGIRGLPFAGGSPDFLDADEGPNVACDEVNEIDERIWAQLGDWVALDATFKANNIHIEIVAFGGDDATPGVVGDVYLFGTASAEPPESETPEPPDIPTDNPVLLVDWDPTEGTGDNITNKWGPGGTHTLRRGGFSSDPGQYPAWNGDPTRGLGPYGGGGFPTFLLRIANNADLPFSTSGGANGLRRKSVTFYLKLVTDPGSGTHWILRNTGGANLNIRLQNYKIQTTHFGAGAGTDNTLVGLTSLVVGQEYMVTITAGREIGEKLRIYLNGVLDNEMSIAFQVSAYTSQPEFCFGGPSGPTFDTGAPVIVGKSLIHDGLLTGAQVAGIYARYRLPANYPGLPAP